MFHRVCDVFRALINSLVSVLILHERSWPRSVSDSLGPSSEDRSSPVAAWLTRILYKSDSSEGSTPAHRHGVKDCFISPFQSSPVFYLFFPFNTCAHSSLPVSPYPGCQCPASTTAIGAAARQRSLVHTSIS